MRKYLAAAVLLLLVACSHSETPASIVFASRATYDATFLAPAANYRQLPICAAGEVATLAVPCADPMVVIQLQNADKAAKAALDAAENVVRVVLVANPKFDATAAIATAQQAVQAAVTIVTTYGIK